MKSVKDLTPVQQAAVTRLYENDETFLVGEMGAGKTVTILTALNELLRDEVIYFVLLVAPVRVCQQVWSKEHLEWEHLKELNIVNLAGLNEKDRLANISKGNIVCINPELLPWLIKTYGMDSGIFDALVVDESSKFKAGGKQFKALRKYLKDFKVRIAATGTPVSEDYESLFYQIMLTDCGAALGRNKQNFLQRYFYDTTPYSDHSKWALLPGADKLINKKIDHLVHVMPSYVAELPPFEEEIKYVELPEKVKDQYKKLKATSVLGDVAAVNAAVLSGKLEQFANGFIYNEEGEAVPVHSEKIRALDEVLTDRPTLIIYKYNDDLTTLTEHFDSQQVQFGVLGGGVCGKTTASIVDTWNSGWLPVLLLHPKAAGHGLNLAKGGHDIIWYTPDWSRDLTEQTNARLWRRGQAHAVKSTMLVSRGTIDELKVQRVDDKAQYHELLMAHFKQA